MPKISVIVPVYRVEAYLDRCVQSILDQTYTDFELILVDDGSPDNCGAMCDTWAQKDSRIQVIHKENGGLSDARNVGFEASTGEWITFIDSDDYVHPNMLEALYNAVKEYNVKVSICGYAHTSGEPLEVMDFTAKVWKPKDFYLQHNVNATVAWGKLYHRSTVLPYPKGKLHEDEYTTYKILFACEQIAVIASPLYSYFLNQQSITKQKWSPKRMDAWDALEQQVNFFIANSDLENARMRISAWWANIKRQMEQIQQDYVGCKKRRYLHCCRHRLRDILKRYDSVMGYNLLDHTWMYILAWPQWKALFVFYCKAKINGHQLVVRVLGEKTFEKIKKRLGRRA